MLAGMYSRCTEMGSGLSVLLRLTTLRQSRLRTGTWEVGGNHGKHWRPASLNSQRATTVGLRSVEHLADHHKAPSLEVGRLWAQETWQEELRDFGDGLYLGAKLLVWDSWIRALTRQDLYSNG